MTYTCIRPACTDRCTDCNEAVPTGHFSVGRANLDDLKRLRADGLAAGAGSGRWIKAATALMDTFPQIYDTAKTMNDHQDIMLGAAADVIDAFEVLDKAKNAGGQLMARNRCETAMLKLSAALKAQHLPPTHPQKGPNDPDR